MMKPVLDNGSGLAARRLRIVILGPVDHLLLGQRARDHLPRPDARAVPARPRGAVSRMRQAVVPRPSRHDRLALRRRAPLPGPRGIAAALGRRDPRRRSGHHRLVCSGRHCGGALGAALSATGIVAFYDIDTPVTLAALADGTCPYLDAALVPRFDLYLSFTGGPALRLLETRYRARAARALYCSVDPERHRPCPAGGTRWDLGYLGTYSADRQPALDALLCEPARRWERGRFAVAGPLYPADLRWPANVERIEHVGPDEHPWFYGRQLFTLNLTRADMVRLGYSPSVRLFEAAACGVPIISDWWPGLATIFEPGSRDPDRPRRRRGAADIARDAGAGA